ncbi:hypothetical protein UVI_02061900 [Ustilaginoidea virens]|nr:hypothetical protein UVI_02061900 [Ustilaginoidea virens]
MAGAILRASDTIYWAQAPQCLALPVIRTIQDSTLEIHNDPNSNNLRRLGRLSPLFRRIWNEGAGKDNATAANRSFQFIGCANDVPNKSAIQELASPPAWNKMLASMAPAISAGRPWTAFVCGPKSAGKSTFARFMTNRLLTSLGDSRTTRRVAVLDLDPGQPEFAPPGTVSLVSLSRPNFGVPFTHAAFDDPGNLIVRCHSLASVTTASAPDLFLACAIDLYETHHRSMRDCPLVINTPGWILGTGLDLLVELITKIHPAEVIYMSEDGPADVVEVLRDATRTNFTALPSQPSEFMSRTAAHFRSMQAMAYFHSQPSIGAKPTSCSSIKWSARPLSTMRPYSVRYQGKNSGILGLLMYDFQSSPDLLAASIDGSILAVVEIEEAAAFQGLGSISGQVGDAGPSMAADITVLRTREGLPYMENPSDGTLDPRYCKTIGLVLVRGIDTEARCLQVITPLPLAKMEQLRSDGRSVVLIHGHFDSPHWAYAEDLHDKSYADELADKEVEAETSDGETSGEDDSSHRTTTQAHAVGAHAVSTVPWIEVLKGSEKRPVGSRVWRVRRDLGRNNTE